MIRRLQNGQSSATWALVFILCCFSGTLTAGQEQVYCNQPPLEAHPKDCCRLPSMIDEDLLRNCKNLHGGEPLQRKLIYERGKCFVECAMNATGTMVNGLLDQVKIMSLIEEATKDDPVLMQLFQGNTLQCLQTSSSDNEQGCSKLGVDFVSCVNFRNFLNCPQHLWNNTDHCNRLKQYIQNCPRPI
ncbi:Odorant-binding protein 50c [Anopheles sinensis]|uniref:Odorant-binding protein 50c n=1 Tax=Anopheles sinensis TaxID=74873 RepID=A0A084WL99_ANOSI|nr:Odorant-binding protein 50c [Anopheles sinensis]